MPVRSRWLHPGQHAIAADSANVYFADQSSGSVVDVAIGGGTAVTLASSQKGPVDLAVDATAVYWVNGDGTVMKVAKP